MSYEATVACKSILGVSLSFVLLPKIFTRLSVVVYLLVKNKIYSVSNDICKQSCPFNVVVFVMLCIILMSYWARWRLKSPASRLFTQPSIQAQIKENIKAPRHWLLCGEFTGDRWIPPQRASNAENVSIWWRLRDTFKTHINVFVWP